MFKGVLRVLASVVITCLAQIYLRHIPAITITWFDLAALVTVILIAWLLVTGFAHLILAATKRHQHFDPSIGHAQARPVAKLRRPDDTTSYQHLEKHARHEAAHTVAVLVLGHELIEVSTSPHFELGFAGYTSWRHPEEPSIDQVTVALIGNLAQPKPNDYRFAQLNDDYQGALRASLAAAMVSGDTPSRVLDDAMSRARQILADHEEDIDKLAAELSHEPTTLTGEKVRELLHVGVDSTPEETSTKAPVCG